jgi:hypothetical protein
VTSNFPGSLDAFTNPVNGDIVDATLIANMADSIEAVEADIGIKGTNNSMCEVLSASSFAAYHRQLGWQQVALSNQRLLLTTFIAPISMTVNNLSCYIDGTGTTSTSSLMGLWTVDASDNGTNIAVTTNDTALFTVQGVRTKALVTPVAITRGTRYAFGILQNGGSMAGPIKLPASGSAGIKFVVPFSSGFRDSQTTMANFTKAGLGGGNADYMWFMVS